MSAHRASGAPSDPTPSDASLLRRPAASEGLMLRLAAIGLITVTAFCLGPGGLRSIAGTVALTAAIVLFEHAFSRVGTGLSAPANQSTTPPTPPTPRSPHE